MATINYAAREINVKIVYYGPALSGKTTNLQIIHKKTPDQSKSDMVSLATEADRTLFFDFLPIDLGKIRGFSTKIQLYTVPGQVYYNATRKLVLRGVDGIVFVADSTPEKMDENIESLNNMEENLAEYGYGLDTIPIVIQMNKRDMPNALSVEELTSKLDRYNAGITEATARVGDGVFQTLKLIGKEVIDFLNQKYASPTSTSGMAASQLPPLSQAQAQAQQPQQQFGQPQQQFGQQQQQFGQQQQPQQPQQQFGQPQQQQFGQPQQQQQQQQFGQQQQQPPQQQQQFGQPQQQQQFGQPQQPQQQQQFGQPQQPQQQQQFGQPQQQQQFGQPQQQQQFGQPQQQQQFGQPQQQQQFGQPQQQQQFGQSQQRQQQFGQPQQQPQQPQQQFGQPQQQQQFGQPQQQQQFGQAQQQFGQQATNDSDQPEVSIDDAFELDFDTGAPEPVSDSPQSINDFSDLILDDTQPAVPQNSSAQVNSNDLEFDSSFTVQPLEVEPLDSSISMHDSTDSSFENIMNQNNEEAVDVNSYFSNEPPKAETPFETANETIAISAIEENSEDKDQPLFFTTVNSDSLKANKKKPINPKHKKNFLDNLFNK